MKHFSDECWADFVRGTGAQVTHTAMQEHMNEGCAQCAAALATWRDVFTLAQREFDLMPPNDIVRIVKSQFAGAPTESRGVRMVFDSALQALTVGVRGSVMSRQFLFETDAYYIDLRLEPSLSANHACVVGQVLGRHGGQNIGGVAISLRQGRLSLDRTITNQHGEFQVEFVLNKDISIVIGADEEPGVVLPLYGLRRTPAAPKHD